MTGRTAGYKQIISLTFFNKYPLLEGFLVLPISGLSNMKILVSILCIVFSLSAPNLEAEGVCATEPCKKAEKILDLPDDVRLFVNTRDGCDHFRGEPWPESDDRIAQERRQFILQNMNELCTGTDKQLKELRNKYLHKRAVNELLSEYEDHVEPE